jgi:hypothetical protein
MQAQVVCKCGAGTSVNDPCPCPSRGVCVCVCLLFVFLLFVPCLCVCVGVALARDACSPCLLTSDNCNPPFLSYLVRSYSSRKPACMPVSHFAVHPKIHLFCSLPISSQALIFSRSLLCISNVPSKGSMWEATESIPEMYVC